MAVIWVTNDEGPGAGGAVAVDHHRGLAQQLGKRSRRGAADQIDTATRRERDDDLDVARWPFLGVRSIRQSEHNHASELPCVRSEALEDFCVAGRMCNLRRQ